MREFFNTAEILAVGGAALPADKGDFSRLVQERGWRSDPRRARLVPGRGRGGGTWEYHVSLLPAEVRARLVAAQAINCQHERDEARSKAHWDRFDRLPEKTKEKARQRLACVDQIGTLARTMTRQAAVALVAREAEISASTLWNWLRLADEVPATDRLAALAPRHVGGTARATISPQAWDALKADWLRPEAPNFESCYRRLETLADAHGWTIPSAKTLKRRLDRELPRAAQVLARKGRKAAEALYPHQTRDRSVFHANQAVNADGHTIDVFVRRPDGTVFRPVLIGIQDLYSGMILAFRDGESESWPLVRHAFADMIETYGIPEHCWLDNGRAFASKMLTGGQKTRFRFKIRDDEPDGVLTGLGMTVHWTTPYHGQAKPIERAFRDVCEDIAKHPKFAGAYVGNRPDAKPDNYGSKAVPHDTFRAVVAEEVRRHNERPGRRTAVCAGRSFADVFRASYEQSLVRRATAAQRRLLLMAAEGVTASRRNGEINLAGNRYWSDRLVDLAGRKVIVRFDPDDLLVPVAVYALDGRFVKAEDALADDAEDLARPVADQMIDRVRALLDEAGSLEEARDGLDALRAKLPIEPLAASLQQALLVAQLSGRAEIADAAEDASDA